MFFMAATPFMKAKSPLMVRQARSILGEGERRAASLLFN
jgi:hypothetical protein